MFRTEYVTRINFKREYTFHKLCIYIQIRRSIYVFQNFNIDSNTLYLFCYYAEPIYNKL